MTTIIGDYTLADGLNDIAAMLDTVDRLKNTNSLAGSLSELKQTFHWIPEAFKLGAALRHPAVDINLSVLFWAHFFHSVGVRKTFLL